MPLEVREHAYVLPSWRTTACKAQTHLDVKSQVATVFAARSSQVVDIDLQNIPVTLSNYIKHLRGKHPDLMRHISATKTLPENAVEVLETALQDSLSQP